MDRDEPPSESGWKLTRFSSACHQGAGATRKNRIGHIGWKITSHADLLARGEQCGPVPLPLRVIEEVTLLVHQARHSSESGRRVVELRKERRGVRLTDHRAHELAGRTMQRKEDGDGRQRLAESPSFRTRDFYREEQPRSRFHGAREERVVLAALRGKRTAGAPRGAHHEPVLSGRIHDLHLIKRRLRSQERRDDPLRLGQSRSAGESLLPERTLHDLRDEFDVLLRRLQLPRRLRLGHLEVVGQCVSRVGLDLPNGFASTHERDHGQGPERHEGERDGELHANAQSREEFVDVHHAKRNGAGPMDADWRSKAESGYSVN